MLHISHAAIVINEREVGMLHESREFSIWAFVNLYRVRFRRELFTANRSRHDMSFNTRIHEP